MVVLPRIARTTWTASLTTISNGVKVSCRSHDVPIIIRGFSNSGIRRLVTVTPSENTSTSEILQESHRGQGDDVAGQFRSTISYLNTYSTAFPSDISTIAKINQYKDLHANRYAIQSIKVGIFYDNKETAYSSRIIETVLADPLSSGNEIWFEQIVTRDREANNIFKYSDQVSVSQNSCYSIPSPILSGQYRPSYASIESETSSPTAVLNNIEIHEVNDLEQIDVEKYHFIITVTNDLSKTINASDSSNRKKLLTVIDNSEWTPSSTESTAVSFGQSKDFHSHAIKIDSNVAFQGIKLLLQNGAKAGGEYFDAARKSNIYELNKSLGYFSRSEVLQSILLDEIRTDISNAHVSQQHIEHIKESLKNEIAAFGNSVHGELQYVFKPATTSFFRKKLSWWKLYIKNDNVEYDLKDYFGKNFMNRSVEEYNYARGNIAAKIHQDYTKNITNIESNPILVLKSQVMDKVVSEIQPFVYKIIGSAFVYYQLPISIISFLSWQYFDFSANSAVALFSLGWIVGFNQVSKNWEAFTNKWLINVFEQIRVCVSRECIDNGLSKELNEEAEQEIALSSLRKEILTGLQNRDN
ncbi:hypothetical protein G9P44_000453 [Scheffersomyces stipitis]|nr:hypothetical protein G9P44_000453 [Scheffersomyces stipitis]